MRKHGYLVGCAIIALFGLLVLYGELTKRPHVPSDLYYIRINRLYYAKSFNGNLEIDHNFAANRRDDATMVVENVSKLAWNRHYIVYARRRVHMHGQPTMFGVINTENKQYFEFHSRQALYRHFPQARTVRLRRPEAYHRLAHIQ